MHDDTETVPLRIPLPDPPFLTLGGVEYVIERVNVNEIRAWREKHNLVPLRRAFLGKPGWRPTADGSVRWAGYGTVMLHRHRGGGKEQG